MEGAATCTSRDGLQSGTAQALRVLEIASQRAPPDSQAAAREDQPRLGYGTGTRAPSPGPPVQNFTGVASATTPAHHTPTHRLLPQRQQGRFPLARASQEQRITGSTTTLQLGMPFPPDCSPATSVASDLSSCPCGGACPGRSTTLLTIESQRALKLSMGLTRVTRFSAVGSWDARQGTR